MRILGKLEDAELSYRKAVKPKNYMGATKRICEIIISNFAKRNIYDDEQNINSTKFLSVRFGNVLGSSGSVIPIFQKQD